MSTRNVTTDQAINEIFRSASDPIVAVPEPSSQTPPMYLDLPDELKTRDNWVCFRHETKPNDETQNAPYCVDTIDGKRHAKSNDSSTWSPFDGAVRASINPARNFDGISFMLLGTPYLGFDFDSVVQNQILDPFVASILRLMGDPYAEISYSDAGLRVLVECAKLPKPKKTIFKEAGHGVEIYHGEWAAKALTITGNRYSGQRVTTITPAQFELVHLLCSQIHDAKFKALWLGDTSAHGRDDSKADFALCCKLARLLDYNAEKIDAAFRMSGLMRTKWMDASGYYGTRTIARAIEFEKSQDVQPSSHERVTAPVSFTADQITPKKIVWLWQNRFAQKLNMLVGNPDVGKGLITYYVMSCVTRGWDWFDGKNTIPASAVLLLSGEEDWDDTIVPRLMAAGADLSKVHGLKQSVTKDGTTTERELQLDRDVAMLEAYLVKHPDIRLVVIDPISNYLGSATMIDEQKVRAEVLTPLKELANRRAVAIICVMHLNKKVELDAIHRIGGCMAFVGVARMVWLCVPKPTEDGTVSDELMMVKVKANIISRTLKGLSYVIKARPVPVEGGSVDAPYTEWTGEVHQTADELIGKPAKPAQGAHRPAEQLPAAEKWLREYLKDGPQPQKEIADQGNGLHEFSHRTLVRAKHEIGARSFRKEHKWFWEMPADADGGDDAAL
jgi:putative DNA primase/helicase